MSLSILKNIGEKDGKQTRNLYSSVVEPKTQKNVTITTTVYWAKTSSYVVHTHHNTYQKANKVTVTTLNKEWAPGIIFHNWLSDNVVIYLLSNSTRFNVQHLRLLVCEIVTTFPKRMWVYRVYFSVTISLQVLNFRKSIAN